MRSLHSQLLAGLVLGLLAACSGNDYEPAATAVIGPGGGTLTVTSGPLAGTSITIPAGALEQDTSVVLDGAANRENFPYENVGPATAVAPTGLELLASGSMTLRFDPALLPATATQSDIVVFRRTSQGRLVFVTPASVDLGGGTVTVEVDRFAAYTVAFQRFDLDFVLPSYLPLLDGDTYAFEEGLSMQVESATNEPSLQGIRLAKATFVRDGADFGFYFSRELAETYWYGEFSRTGDFQSLVAPALFFLGETGNFGSVFTDTGVLRGFVPYGAPFPVGIEVIDSRVEIASAGQLRTPAGLFPSVLEVVFTTVRQDPAASDPTSPGQPSGQTTTVDRLWLALGVGPVAVELDGNFGGRVGLTAAVVGGLPILATGQ